MTEIGYYAGHPCALQADGTLLFASTPSYMEKFVTNNPGYRLFYSIDTLEQEKEAGYQAFLKKQDEQRKKRQLLENRINELQREKASLGLFARKRKQEIEKECRIIQMQLDNDYFV